MQVVLVWNDVRRPFLVGPEGLCTTGPVLQWLRSLPGNDGSIRVIGAQHVASGRLLRLARLRPGQWDAFLPAADFEEGGEYSLLVEDVAGCRGTLCLAVEVADVELDTKEFHQRLLCLELSFGSYRRAVVRTVSCRCNRSLLVFRQRFHLVGAGSTQLQLALLEGAGAEVAGRHLDVMLLPLEEGCVERWTSLHRDGGVLGSVKLKISTDAGEPRRAPTPRSRCSSPALSAHSLPVYAEPPPLPPPSPPPPPPQHSESHSPDVGGPAAALPRRRQLGKLTPVRERPSDGSDSDGSSAYFPCEEPRRGPIPQPYRSSGGNRSSGGRRSCSACRRTPSSAGSVPDRWPTGPPHRPPGRPHGYHTDQPPRASRPSSRARCGRTPLRDADRDGDPVFHFQPPPPRRLSREALEALQRQESLRRVAEWDGLARVPGLGAAAHPDPLANGVPLPQPRPSSRGSHRSSGAESADWDQHGGHLAGLGGHRAAEGLWAGAAGPEVVEAGPRAGARLVPNPSDAAPHGPYVHAAEGFHWSVPIPRQSSGAAVVSPNLPKATGAGSGGHLFSPAPAPGPADSAAPQGGVAPAPEPDRRPAGVARMEAARPLAARTETAPQVIRLVKHVDLDGKVEWRRVLVEPSSPDPRAAPERSAAPPPSPSPASPGPINAPQRPPSSPAIGDNTLLALEVRVGEGSGLPCGRRVAVRLDVGGYKFDSGIQAVPPTGRVAWNERFRFRFPQPPPLPLVAKVCLLDTSPPEARPLATAHLTVPRLDPGREVRETVGFVEGAVSHGNVAVQFLGLFDSPAPSPAPPAAPGPGYMPPLPQNDPRGVWDGDRTAGGVPRTPPVHPHRHSHSPAAIPARDNPRPIRPNHPVPPPPAVPTAAVPTPSGPGPAFFHARRHRKKEERKRRKARDPDDDWDAPDISSVSGSTACSSPSSYAAEEDYLSHTDSLTSPDSDLPSRSPRRAGHRQPRPRPRADAGGRGDRRGSAASSDPGNLAKGFVVANSWQEAAQLDASDGAVNGTFRGQPILVAVGTRSVVYTPGLAPPAGLAGPPLTPRSGVGPPPGPPQSPLMAGYTDRRREAHARAQERSLSAARLAQRDQLLLTPQSAGR